MDYDDTDPEPDKPRTFLYSLADSHWECPSCQFPLRNNLAEVRDLLRKAHESEPWGPEFPVQTNLPCFYCWAAMDEGNELLAVFEADGSVRGWPSELSGPSMFIPVGMASDAGNEASGRVVQLVRLDGSMRLLDSLSPSEETTLTRSRVAIVSDTLAKAMRTEVERVEERQHYERALMMLCASASEFSPQSFPREDMDALVASTFPEAVSDLGNDVAQLSEDELKAELDRVLRSYQDRVQAEKDRRRPYIDFARSYDLSPDE